MTLDLLILSGRDKAVTPRGDLVAALAQVEIRQEDDGPGGFSLTLNTHRGGRLPSPKALVAGDRMVFVGRIGAKAAVLMDGVVAELHREPGGEEMQVTGQDLRLHMQLKEAPVNLGGLGDKAIAMKVLGRYAHLGVAPDLHLGNQRARDSKTGANRVKVMTHLALLEGLARDHGQVFRLEYGALPNVVRAYIGPRRRKGARHARALLVDMGPATTVNSLSFAQDGGAASRGTLRLHHPKKRAGLPAGQLRPDAAPLQRQRLMHRPVANAGEARLLARGLAQAGKEQVRSAKGELDTLRYGAALLPGRAVKVGGVASSETGDWVVSSVTHLIQPGSWTQSFSLYRSQASP